MTGFHTLAYFSALGVNASDTQVSAVQEAIFTVKGGNFQVPRLLSTWAGWYNAPSAIRARIETASLGLRGYPQIQPYNRVLVPGNNPNVMDFRMWPLPLKPMEDIRMSGSNNLGAATESSFGGLWVSDTDLNFNVNNLDLRWIRFTATVTEAVGAWSNIGPVTFQDTLESGKYGIYGMECWSANTVLARLVLQDQVYRPGVVSNNAAGQRTHEMFRGGMGLFGYFNSYSVPQIETLSSVAGAATIEGKLLCAKAAA